MTFSFVIPAHDEEALLGAALSSLRAAAEAAREPYEIIVVDDASTDRTAAIAAAAGARVVPVAFRQISAVRNAGARVASGDTLVFVDADTHASPEAVRGVLDARRAGAIGGGARVRFDEPIPAWARRLMPLFMGSMVRLRWAAGCFVFVSRDAFNAVGGFDESLFASEEIALSRALKRRGRFVMLPDYVRTSGRKLRTYSGLEVLWLGVRVTVWPWSLKRRSALPLWYGKRREDPR
jgi:glycosyltransferase involved in cell wall biosynthesis